MLQRLHQDERGETFIELVVSTILLGILGLGMITALSSTIIVSNADRGFVGSETVLRSFATTLERRPYKACTVGSSANPYTTSDLSYSAPTGYTTTVTSVKFLVSKNSADVSSPSAFSTTCPTSANGGDQGAQLLTLKASKSDGSVPQVVNVILRRGDS